MQVVVTGRTALVCAGSVSTTVAAPTSRMWMAPSLVPTTAWRPPGANSAHRPCPAVSTVRRHAPLSALHTCACGEVDVVMHLIWIKGLQ